ncbi:MAG: peptidoglycan DD-metalloendopeptidase family protein [Alphaproteobacteria bacterium]|nr:peptidoglycan DD-metalloendopeptidase family protein [Alphaproteobacteria bacterium]MBU1517177.1 peptidoglycan DD-metalloendopeptidase family protein [Alphaproteobacteria bacterium]MBU2093287.1 peptidoglycan DD-metalloendopeptidase family protein [Alphaproteobacteria bacterium]MBU2150036.1 peptidoglycan DD-metalloendopeptidase family protein [Alphaproteobacteria bacterium]MBU2307793.1 peptidoglycan DD-metalloendopeptidase family protein [Alphaproteobacteria bacterium]
MTLGAAAWAANTGKLERLNLAETELTVDQGVNMHRLSRLLSVLEQLSRDPPPALLVSPDDAKDAVRAAILVKALTPDLAGRAQGYAQGASEVMRQRRLAAVQSEALFERDSLAAEALPTPDSTAELRLRGTVREDPADLTPPTRLVFPAAGTVVRGFGAPIAGGGRSNGMTLSAAKGARAVSPAAGLVQYVGPVKGWDVIVILRLAGGYHLVLAGLERTSVQVGQSVTEGQPVGWATDGRHATSELYLEVRDQGSPVDPAKWLVKNRG